MPRVVAVVMMMGLWVACYSSFEEGGPRGPERSAGRHERSAVGTATAPRRTDSAKRTTPAQRPQKPKQTYAQAWRVICDAEELSGGDPSRVAAWIVANLKNDKARYWFIALGNVKPEQRLKVFVAEAKAAGYRDCPSAALLFPGYRAPTTRPERR